jgi:hypothetical protein
MCLRVFLKKYYSSKGYNYGGKLALIEYIFVNLFCIDWFDFEQLTYLR